MKNLKESKKRLIGKVGDIMDLKNIKTELFNDNFQNYKRYGIPKAQLVIADIPYNVGTNFYGSNPMWYKGGDIVIDPCAGSGSTLRAAMECGRNSYGFEISKEFYRRAKDEMLVVKEEMQLHL